MSNTSEIVLSVTVDENKVPKTIHWRAPEGGVPNDTETKAFLLSLWDSNQREALRIDLWNKNMMIDEMNDFFFQTLVALSETYKRATNQDKIGESMKAFAMELKIMMEEEAEKNQL